MKPLLKKAADFIAPLWTDHAKRRVDGSSFWAGLSLGGATLGLFCIHDAVTFVLALGGIAMARAFWLALPADKAVPPPPEP